MVGGPSYSTHVPFFNVAEDPQAVKSHVPSLQTELMRDLELLGEHIVALGNQYPVRAY